jgi:hypothetical protein
MLQGPEFFEVNIIYIIFIVSILYDFFSQVGLSMFIRLSFHECVRNLLYLLFILGNCTAL